MQPRQIVFLREKRSASRTPSFWVITNNADTPHLLALIAKKTQVPKSTAIEVEANRATHGLGSGSGDAVIGFRMGESEPDLSVAFAEFD